MDNFIVKQNIRLFRAKLAESTDSAQRAEIQKLLSAEEAKLVKSPNAMQRIEDPRVSSLPKKGPGS